MLPDYQLLDAVKHNDLAEARDAFDRGANPDARDFNGLTALQVACTQGHMPMAELLLTLNADLNATFGKRKQTLLHWAADQGSFGIASFCLTHKVQVNAQQADGSTPLMLAAKGGHQYVVQLLLKNNALLSPRDRKHATARSVAERGGHYQIVKLIDAASDSRPWLRVAEQACNANSGERQLF